MSGGAAAGSTGREPLVIEQRGLYFEELEEAVRVYQQAISFFSTNETVFTALSASFTGLFGLPNDVWTDTERWFDRYLKGTANGETILHNVMSDEEVEVGDNVLTSGGDRVYPKGLPVGTVTDVSPGPDVFLRVRIRPAARLERLEEVLIITRVEERGPSVDDLTGPVRAADILTQRLPSVPEPTEKSQPGNAGGAPPPTRNLPPVSTAPRAVPPESIENRAANPTTEDNSR